MANMNVNERMQYERDELKVPSTGVRLRSTRPLVIYMALAVPLLGALIFAAIAGIDNWWQGLVFAMIFVTTIGAMIALSPNRRA
jgi:hypothetical protein